MKIEGTGAVNGRNDDVKWSKQLADKLDEADGKKDGKISANIWNDFLGDNNSKGNKINYFINLNRAEVSFDYYLKKKDKDVEGLDWNNWKEMFNTFIDSNANMDKKLKFNDADTEGEVSSAQKTQTSTDSQPTEDSQVTNTSGSSPSEQTQEPVQQVPESGEQALPTIETLNANLNNFTLGNSTIPSEADLLSAGYTLQKEGNEAKVYTNSDGETVTISVDGKSLVYQSNDTIIVRSYDSNGNLTQNAIAVSTAPGVFSTGVAVVDDSGVPTLVPKKQHSLPTTLLEYYKDGIEGHKEHIDKLRQMLDISNEISFDISNLRDEDLPKDIISEDGAYKVHVEITNDNVLKVTYYKKQDDNNTELGYFFLNKKESPNTLRGYDFTFSGHTTGGKAFSEPSAKWNDFE